MASKKGLYKSEFIELCKSCSLVVDEDEFDLAVDYIEHCGVKTVQKDDKIYTKSRFEEYKKATYCVVDIETSGNTPQNSQIIEIGAIKYQKGEVIDRFESFVYCDFVPEYIEKITNISKEDLKNAPKLKSVLLEFREFLSDAVFVAHNVRFDYNFISESFKKYQISEILNRRLCTIDLARKTIESEKYGLSFLKEKLGIDIDNHHRAYADAMSALEIFKISLRNIPDDVVSTEDLITFSNPSKKKKKKKERR
ncbi:MAG: 3'-5' exonuclease [Epsilonproteobacteria bacterium]|nr:3'-5' exonuclease [Campylobacterota bacterium]